MTNIAQSAIDAERVSKATALRVRGCHWNEIAVACGYSSPAAALKAVGEAMAAATQRAEESADQMRDTAQMRYDMLLNKTIGMLNEAAPYDENGVQPDDRALRLRAVDEARRLIEAGLKLNGVAGAEAGGKDDGGIRVVGIDPTEIV